MYTLMSVSGGTLFEAILVYRTRNRMRVIAPGFSDALELRRRGQTWSTETGATVEFAVLAAAPATHSLVAPAACIRAAGSG